MKKPLRKKINKKKFKQAARNGGEIRVGIP